MDITVKTHPLLAAAAFETTFPSELEALTTPASWRQLFALDAPAPFGRCEELRKAVRDLLRHGGYKPTGRGKPASEYLVRAAENEALGPINVAVDACNIVSLHSGLPISVIDVERAEAPLHIAVAPESARYVFNATGQEIDLKGLLCLHDAVGPCANGVKDSQRTKTHTATKHTLSVIWGTLEFPGLADEVATWYRELLDTAFGGAAGITRAAELHTT